MLPASHRQAAEDIEATVATISSNPQAARVVIEACWGAAFHWIASPMAPRPSTAAIRIITRIW
jgi:hypothetical protein